MIRKWALWASLFLSASAWATGPQKLNTRFNRSRADSYSYLVKLGRANRNAGNEGGFHENIALDLPTRATARKTKLGNVAADAARKAIGTFKEGPKAARTWAQQLVVTNAKLAKETDLQSHLTAAQRKTGQVGDATLRDAQRDASLAAGAHRAALINKKLVDKFTKGQ